MMGYRYSANRKRHQRQVNKVFRALNKNIEKDELWQGRFVARQRASYFVQYEDKSGYYLVVVYDFLDKKTGQTSRLYNELGWSLSFFNGTKLFMQMNDFIVLDCDVWGVKQKKEKLKEILKINKA